MCIIKFRRMVVFVFESKLMAEEEKPPKPPVSTVKPVQRSPIKESNDEQELKPYVGPLKEG